MGNSQSDVVVIGGGIVGLATAYQLQQNNPQLRIIVLEKEKGPAFHQTGHNSGVLHSGIYYKPGSLKAQNCREGKRAMEDFCRKEGIEFELCGKVIVATEEKEISLLENIFKRGKENGVTCEIIEKKRLNELEPHCAGIKAIHVPEAGIVDYQKVCQRLADKIEELGKSRITYSSKVKGIEKEKEGHIVFTEKGERYKTHIIVNCAGLYSDHITKLSQKSEVKIIPFRGEYYELRPEAHHLCRNLIYPVPDPAFPFLGVHFTRMINGSVECGPNAVLAFAREGYKKSDIRWNELLESLTYPGFLKLAMRYWKMGMEEMWRSYSKAAFVRALQRLVPEIKSEHLVKAPAGVRAQAVSIDGKMVDDFVIQETEEGSIFNVCNAPSPAATASLNIGKTIAERVLKKL